MSDDQYRLVMPFVVCVSNGGPYDDNSFCAGWEMGKLDILLSTTTHPRIGTTVRRDNLPQADLIAMNHNWMMKEEEVIPSGISSAEVESYKEWARVTFSRVT